MKYFSPNYWFKLWVLSAPLFNDKTQGINAKSIDNKKIKDWVSNNTSLELIKNQELTLSNNQTNLIQLQNDENIKSIKNLETDHFYENLLKTQSWSKDPQIVGQQLQEIQEEHHQFLKAHHKRIKRKDEGKKIAYVDELEIGYDDVNYLSNILRIIGALENNNIIERIFERDNIGSGGNIVPDTIFQTLRNSEYEYFVMPVSYEATGNDVRLIFRTDNLYLEGFIVTYHPGGHLPDINNYYYFDDARLRVFPTISNETYDSINLGFNGHYSTLWTETLQTRSINWVRIVSAFNGIRNYDNSNSNNEQNRNNLALVVLTTAEALRFRGIFQLILNLSTNHDSHTDWNIIQPIVNNWSTYSRIILEVLESTDNVRANANLLRALSVAIIAYSFIRNENNRCNQPFIKTKIEDEVCKIISEIKKIEGKIISIKILDKNTKGGNLKAGNIYVATENDIYLIYGDNRVDKFKGLNFPITSIKLDNSGSAYITNNQEEVYHLNLVGWGSEKLKNIESSNLEEEIKIYYEDHHDDLYIESSWFFGDRNTNVHLWKTIMLKKLNPLCYKKIDFIGEDFDWTKTTWGNSKFTQGRKLLTYWNKSKFKNIVSNYKIFESNKDDIRKYSNLNVQKLPRQYLGAEYVEGNQYFGLTWYEENYEFYLQFLYDQFYKHYTIIFRGGSGFIGLGKGIKLYDYIQDCQNYKLNRNESEIIDIENLKEKKETKWNDDFTKSINNEQNLPIINNSNVIKSNITSL